MVADARHAAWNLDTRQTRAVIERIVADARHTAWNLDARQTSAISERILADSCHAIGLAVLLNRGGNDHIAAVAVVVGCFIRHCHGQVRA